METKRKILRDLKKLYREALNQEHLSIALKIVELQAKLEGFFSPSKHKAFSVKSLSSDQLQHLINELEEK